MHISSVKSAPWLAVNLQATQYHIQLWTIWYACVPKIQNKCFSSGNSHNKCRFDSLWCGMTDRCINALESHFWDVQKHAGINPKQASTRAAATSSGSRVWTGTCRTLVTSRARVNAIIPSSVLLVLTWINMTEHLMPHVITQCFNRGNTSTKRK